MADVSALRFMAPRDCVEFDCDALLSTIPSATRNKRIFVEFILAEVADRISAAELLARARVDLAPGEPFDDVPWHDYFRVMFAAAELLAGPERSSAGLRQLGRAVYPRLLATPAGKLLLGRQLADALRETGEVWMQFNDIGRVRAEYRSEREYYYHFAPYPDQLTDTVVLGVFEGMFRHHHTPVDIGLARPAPNHSIMRFRW